MTPEGTVSYIDLIFNMVTKTATEERSSKSVCRNSLSLYMSNMHNCHGLFVTYLLMMNDVIFSKLWKHVVAVIPLTLIDILQVLRLALFYNPQLELDEQEKRCFTQQVFGQ